MRDRKLISRFDPNRKENLIKKQLSNKGGGYKDYTRLNILSTSNNEKLVENITRVNF